MAAEQWEEAGLSTAGRLTAQLPLSPLEGVWSQCPQVGVGSTWEAFESPPVQGRPTMDDSNRASSVAGYSREVGSKGHLMCGALGALEAVG